MLAIRVRAACGRPTTRPTDLRDHRNNIDELAAYLDKKIGENYLVYNLSNKNRNMIDYSKFHNSVVEFQPFSRSDVVDDTPAMGQIFRICYSLKFWFDWGPETAAVLHCNTGVLRTGFILACYMVYIGEADSVEQALQMFSRAREVCDGLCNESQVGTMREYVLRTSPHQLAYRYSTAACLVRDRYGATPRTCPQSTTMVPTSIDILLPSWLQPETPTCLSFRCVAWHLNFGPYYCAGFGGG